MSLSGLKIGLNTLPDMVLLLMKSTKYALAKLLFNVRNLREKIQYIIYLAKQKLDAICSAL